MVLSHLVTPYAGVWIEIDIGFTFEKITTSHSLRGSVDWNTMRIIYGWSMVGHSLRGSVDWNQNNLEPIQVLRRHSLRGSVDWNW